MAQARATRTGCSSTTPSSDSRASRSAGRRWRRRPQWRRPSLCRRESKGSDAASKKEESFLSVMIHVSDPPSNSEEEEEIEERLPHYYYTHRRRAPQENPHKKLEVLSLPPKKTIRLLLFFVRAKSHWVRAAL